MVSLSNPPVHGELVEQSYIVLSFNPVSGELLWYSVRGELVEP